jgi:chemotaxis protein histidine kinase CheA
MALDVRRFIARFVDEARDHLQQMEDGLRRLEGDPTDQAVIDAVFRSAHTIKGSSRMLKLMPIAETAHRLEDVLGALRDGGLTLDGEGRRVLQGGVDAIGRQVDQVAAGTDLAPADQALCDRLATLLTGPADGLAVPPALPERAPAESEAAPKGADPVPKASQTVRVGLDKLDDLIRLMGEVVSSHARLRQRLADVRAIERRSGGGLGGFIRDLRDDVFAQERLMEDLHGKALAMRMLPLSMLFDPIARQIRDLGQSLGKEVDCLVAGADIALDRQLIDRLGDPLLHLLRNAVDHGIEPADRRRAAGKPAVGTIRLTARQDAGWAVITVSDDGAGLPLDEIRAKAVRKGLLADSQASALSDREAIGLIFTPGFSTSPILTELSGRGVGMDVVKRAVVGDMQGTIDVETAVGQGTSFVLRLPLSLALMRVLLVAAGGQQFAFSGQYVAGLMSLPLSRLRTVADREVVVIDSEFVPVASLAGLLGLPERWGRPDTLLLVLIDVRGKRMAVRVDALVDEADMVIKPLPDHLRGLPLVSGMVMTGRDALIAVLQAPALLDLDLAGRSAVRAVGEATARRVLVVDDSLNTREIEKDVLEAHGYAVTLAEDGRDGLQKAQAGDFDAILTDIEMPHMDGFALTEALRATDRYRDCPIVIVTSRQNDDDRRRGIAVGADAYIVKGDFDQNSLAETLRSLLG